MSQALAEIERIKRNEQIAAFNRNEAALLEKLVPPPRANLDEHRGHIGPFVEWCSKQGVRHCPARPATVATFIAEHAGRGETFALNTFRAIEALHEYHGYTNPAQTALVRLALEPIVTDDPPRSWPKNEKVMFALLPPDIRAIIARREEDRERGLRQAQNKLAEERKALEQKANGSETKTDSITRHVEGAERISGPD